VKKQTPRRSGRLSSSSLATAVHVTPGTTGATTPVSSAPLDEPIQPIPLSLKQDPARVEIGRRSSLRAYVMRKPIRENRSQEGVSLSFGSGWIGMGEPRKFAGVIGSPTQ